jgi:glycosyltransferase involved in cell wall biosynthesis
MPGKPNMKDYILFFDVHHLQYLPLIRAVAAEGFTPIMNGGPLTDACRGAGLSVRSWEAYTPKDLQSRADGEINRLATELGQAIHDPQVRQAFAAPQGDFLSHICNPFISQLIQILYMEIAAIETCRALVRRQTPRLIVLGCDNSPSQRALVLFAAQTGIPTLQLAHGMLGPGWGRVAGEMHTLYSQYLATHGRRSRDFLVAQGNPPERIFLTGAPTWDELYRPDSRIDPLEARRRLGLDPHRPVALFTTSYVDGSSAFFAAIARRHHTIHDAVLRAVADIGGGVQLVVRPHPNEVGRVGLSPQQTASLDRAYVDFAADRYGLQVKLCRTHKIEAMRAAEVVVVIGQSSVIPEAMILERPVVLLPLFPKKPCTYTSADGIAIAEDDAQLPGILDHLLQHAGVREEMVSRQNAVIPDINHGHDGRASDRTAQLIEKLGRPIGNKRMEKVMDQRVCGPTPASTGSTTEEHPSSWTELDQVYTTSRRKLSGNAAWRYGPKRVWEVAREAFEALSAVTPLEGKVFCDLGCGEHHPFGTSTVMLLNGAHATIAIDKVRADTRRGAEALFDLLMDCLIDPEAWHWSKLAREDFISKIHQFDLKALKSGNLEKGIAGVAIEHRVEDILKMATTEKIDLMSSRAALEHFWDFKTAMNKLFAMMSHGGIAFHNIDLTDHRAYVDPSRFHWWSFLAEDDDWSDGLCNRLRASEIRKILETAGFSILKCEERRAKMPGGFRRLLKGRFAQMPDEELEIVGINILIKKPEQVERLLRLPVVGDQARSRQEMEEPLVEITPVTGSGGPVAPSQFGSWEPSKLGEPDELASGLDLLFVAHNFLPHGYAGTEIYTRDLALAMQARGHQVRVIYPRPVHKKPGEPEFTITEGNFEGLEVAKILAPLHVYSAIRNEALKPVLRQFLEKHRPDLVHVQHLMGLTVSFLEVLREMNIPVVITFNDFWPFCTQIHLVKPDGLVCEGPETIDKCVRCMAKHLGNIPREQMPHFSNCLATRYFTNREAVKLLDLAIFPARFQMELYQRYQFDNQHMVHLPQGANLFTPLETALPSPPPVIISYLGTICYRKGLDVLVKAFNRVESAAAELHLYGNVIGEQYFQAIKENILPGKKVIYHGAYSSADLPRILALTHIAVVPSRGENYPFVIREILHARVPVIAAAVAGIPEIIRDGENGLLFGTNDPVDLAAKLKMVIDRPQFIEEMRAGIKPVKSLAEDAQDIEKLYRKVLGERALAARDGRKEIQHQSMRDFEHVSGLASGTGSQNDKPHLKELQQQFLQKQLAALEGAEPKPEATEPNPEDLLAKVTEAIEHQDWPTAESFLLKLNRCYPDLPEPYLILADVLRLQGRHREAAQARFAARQLNPQVLPEKNGPNLNSRSKGEWRASGMDPLAEAKRTAPSSPAKGSEGQHSLADRLPASNIIPT